MHLEKFMATVFPLKSRLYRLARWMLSGHEDAEDLTQEVLLKLWARREDLGRYHSIEALAVRMTKNLCLNQLKAQRQPMLDAEEQPLVASTLAPDLRLEQEDTVEILYRLIVQLPARQRLIVQLRDVEGMEVEEIARLSDMKPSNVRASLSLGRKKIRTLYYQWYGIEE
jgi:RNA polymerase sigma-70 factor (ECF subfamily)